VLSDQYRDELKGTPSRPAADRGSRTRRRTGKAGPCPEAGSSGFDTEATVTRKSAASSGGVPSIDPAAHPTTLRIARVQARPPIPLRYERTSACTLFYSDRPGPGGSVTISHLTGSYSQWWSASAEHGSNPAPVRDDIPNATPWCGVTPASGCARTKDVRSQLNNL